MWNEDHTLAIVYNGEVYNHGAIRLELIRAGHTFRSTTDTEVVLHAYEEWGSKCVERFNGMWAFAIYDTREGLLFLSRDRFGIKPLYYGTTPQGRFVFCSELRGLFVGGVSKGEDERTMFDYLYYTLVDHSENTFYRDVRRLPPGHNMHYFVSGAGYTIRKWYHLEPKKHGDIADLLKDAVSLRMVADVPVGSCLSGGLDSSSIVCMMRILNPRQTIRTFSAVFPGSSVDELPYAARVAHDVEAAANYMTPDVDDLLRDADDLMKTQEEPFGSTSMYAQYRVMKLAASLGMKVLLDGQGNDEVFAGYHSAIGFNLYELLLTGKIASFLRELNMVRHKVPLYVLAHSLMPAWMRRIARMSYYCPWINREFYEAYAQKAEREHPMNGCRTLNEFLTASVLYTSIPQLLRYEDRNSMRWSIETRLPFLDYRFVEHAMSLPAEDKVAMGTTKYAFRKAMRGILPDVISYRRDKIGFATPESEWFATDRMQRWMRDIVDSSEFASRPWWNAKAIRSMKSFGPDMWRPICAELWRRRV